jgi:hypothetical protein
LSGLVPNPFALDGSNLCCSRADFFCPDDCPEGDLCTVTGEPREEPLYRMLEELEVPGVTVLVLRSRQIMPGIGGYLLGELMDLTERIPQGRSLIATSCKCHGVITSIEKVSG